MTRCNNFIPVFNENLLTSFMLMVPDCCGFRLMQTSFDQFLTSLKHISPPPTEICEHQHEETSCGLRKRLSREAEGLFHGSTGMKRGVAPCACDTWLLLDVWRSGGRNPAGSRSANHSLKLRDV